MAIKILRATEVISIEHIVMLIYGQPGIGKSSTLFTAEGVLNFDFDAGAHRSGFRRDIVQIESWRELEELDPAKDFEGYDTIGIDTAGRCLDKLSVRIIEDEPKMGQRDGSLTMKGWGELKKRFTSWVKLVRESGRDVVLVAHEREDRKGDDHRVIRPDISGGSYGEVFKLSDAIGYQYMGGGRRVLDFNPADEWVAKNPAGMKPIKVPDFAETPDFLARVIADTKRALGRMSEVSMRIAAEVEGWDAKVAGLNTVTEFNEMLDYMTGDAPGEVQKPVLIQAKGLLWSRARELGHVWDGEAKIFKMVPVEGPSSVPPQAEAPPVSEEQPEAAAPVAEPTPEPAAGPIPEPAIEPPSPVIDDGLAPEPEAGGNKQRPLFINQQRVNFVHPKSGELQQGVVTGGDNDTVLVLPNGKKQSVRVDRRLEVVAPVNAETEEEKKGALL